MPDKKRVIFILRIIAFFVTLISIIIFPPWDGILLWLAPLPDSVQSQVDDAINHDLAGIIVYVDQTGREPAFYAAGWKDRAGQVPADPHALFKIASISKMYVAVAAVKLIHAGRLSPDDTVADHFPDLVGRLEYADQITLKMLLQHRSGLPNYTDLAAFDWTSPPATVEATLALVLDHPAYAKPDTQYAYCNTNFLLIGKVIDKVLGYSHRDFIRQEILTPHHLKRTFTWLKEAPREDLVSGYHLPYDQDFKEATHVTAAGAMVASAQDVGTFVRALNDGSLLNKEEQRLYTEFYPLGHTGWVLGYQSVARYHADIDTVVIQFVNTTGAESIMITGIIYDRIVKILRNKGS